MKAFYKLLLILIILSLAIPFYLKGPDGRQLLSLSDIDHDLSTLSSNLKNTVLSSIERIKHIDGSDNTESAQEKSATTTLYRWLDAQGQWHFSNKPNETSEPFKVTPNSSIPVPRQTPPDSEDTVVTAPSDLQSNGQNKDLPSPFSAKQVIQTLEEAKNIQKLMDNRTEQLDEAIRQAAK